MTVQATVEVVSGWRSSSHLVDLKYARRERPDRLLLYVMTGVEVLVLTTKRSYAGRDFKGNEMAVSANSSRSCTAIAIGDNRP